MAPSGSPNDHEKFLLACLKHTKDKPDFDSVAKELGLKNANAAYMKHWAIMKKAGVAGNKGKGGRKPANTTTPPTPTRKRVHGCAKTTTPTKTTEDGSKAEDEDEEDMDVALALGLVEDEDNGEVFSDMETPSKKRKQGNFLGRL